MGCHSAVAAAAAAAASAVDARDRARQPTTRCSHIKKAHHF